MLELFPTLFTNLFTFGFIQLDPVHHHHLSDASTKDGALENKRLSLRHKQSHRGAGPKDERLFGAGARPALRVAMRDLCWLLTRGFLLRKDSTKGGISSSN